MNASRLTLALLLGFAALSACSKSSPAPDTAAPASDTAASTPTQADIAKAVAAANQTDSRKACELVTAAEMSTILGSTVAAEPNESSSGKTECIYKPASGISPYVEFSVEWGEGETAMKAAGMMDKHEPGIASPYDGIGDQAVAVGPSLLIRNGNDAIWIVFSGVDDAPAKAKKIFDTAKARF
jgi:hypothetical protein